MTPTPEFLDHWLLQTDRHGKPRTQRDESTGCLTWLGAFSFQVPKAHVPGLATNNALNLRRLVIESRLGRPLDRAEFATHKCGNQRCLEPSHLFVASRLEIQQRTKAEGKWDADKCTDRARRGAITRLPVHFTPQRVRELLIAVYSGENITTAARTRRMGVKAALRIVSWEIPAALGMDRLLEEPALRAAAEPRRIEVERAQALRKAKTALRRRLGIPAASKARITIAQSRFGISRWCAEAPPALFSAVPLGGFLDGAQV